VARLPGNSEAVSLRTVIDEWRVQWPTGVATMLGIGLCTSIIPIIFSLFIQPLEAEFGWSRGEIAAVHSTSLLSAMLAPFAGRLLDLRGVRTLMLTGMTMMGLCYCLFAWMQGQLWQFYLITAIMTIVGIPTSGLAFGRVISAAFVRSRGFSLAVGRSGMAFSGVLLPTLLYFVISHWGWRAGYLTMAALILLVALPAAWAWIETGPAAIGKTQAAKPLPVRTLLSNWRIPVVALAAALAYMPILAILSQLQPMLTEDGLSPGVAASMIGLIGVATLLGALCTGLLIDRFWAPMIAFIMLCLAAAGALLLVFSQGNVTLVMIGIVLLGLGQGAEHDLVAFTVARYFGVANFSGVYGLTIFAISSLSALGHTAVGYSHDYTGNYDLALYGSAVSLVMAGVLYLMLGAYPVRLEIRGGEAGPA
jgi:MFS family permease